jgi:hypothetical protein
MVGTGEDLIRLRASQQFDFEEELALLEEDVVLAIRISGRRH